MTSLLALTFTVLGGSLASAQTVQLANTQSPIGVGLSNPGAMAIDSSGNLYVIDTGNHRIVKETLLPGYNYVQSVVPTTMANPLWIAADNSGSVYLSDATNHNLTGDGIYKETPSGSGYTETKLFSGRSFAGLRSTAPATSMQLTNRLSTL